MPVAFPNKVTGSKNGSRIQTSIIDAILDAVDVDYISASGIQGPRHMVPSVIIETIRRKDANLIRFTDPSQETFCKIA